MSANNPLFVDSTKFFSDSITTRIELRRLLLRDNEKAMARITPSGQPTQIKHLHTDTDGLHNTSLELNHQQEIQIQFYIEVDNEIILASPTLHKKANYVISIDWQPDENAKDKLNESLKNENTQKAKTDQSSSENDNEFPALDGSSRRLFGQLIDKWGL